MKPIQYSLFSICLFLFCSATAQQTSDEKPAYYTDKGATKITATDLKTMDKSNDLMIKIPITEGFWKYDKIIFMINGSPAFYASGADLYHKTYLKNELKEALGDQKELSLWVFNPEKGKNFQPYNGDFLLKSQGTTYLTCPDWVLGKKSGMMGKGPRKGCTISFSVKAHMQTGTKKEFFNNAWNDVPVYDAGEIISKSDDLVIK